MGPNILGIVLLIFSLVFFFCVVQYLDMTVSAMDADMGFRYSLKASARMIDMDHLKSTGSPIIHEQNARTKFNQKIAQNLCLNPDLSVTDKSKLVDRISILEFEVRNAPSSTDVFIEPYWKTKFTAPGIHCIIEIKLRELFFGEGLNIKLHYDVDLSRI